MFDPKSLHLTRPSLGDILSSNVMRQVWLFKELKLCLMHETVKALSVFASSLRLWTVYKTQMNFIFRLGTHLQEIPFCICKDPNCEKKIANLKSHGSQHLIEEYLANTPEVLPIFWEGFTSRLSQGGLLLGNSHKPLYCYSGCIPYPKCFPPPGPRQKFQSYLPFGLWSCSILQLVSLE